MAKAGDAYQELVGAVMAALDPGSAVKTEQWITGPDGERDMDVEVQGTLHGVPHFILVECKDHARPIGIGFVDGFESKIRDLKPDRAIMFSNSGFTRRALKKANRVKIEMASAMKVKDDTVKIEVHRKVVARRLTLTFGTLFLYPFDGHPHEIEENHRLDHGSKGPCPKTMPLGVFASPGRQRRGSDRLGSAPGCFPAHLLFFYGLRVRHMRSGIKACTGFDDQAFGVDIPGYHRSRQYYHFFPHTYGSL